jgi:heme/copper-type cytochrome/quinol oxidase subunit 1
MRDQEANVQWIVNFLSWLGETPPALAIAQSEWMFPVFEVVHIFAISMVFGTVAIIDLRLLGLASTNRRYTELARELLPWTWGAWFVAAAFGTLLMASRPASYFANTDYRLKFRKTGYTLAPSGAI